MLCFPGAGTYLKTGHHLYAPDEIPIGVQFVLVVTVGISVVTLVLLTMKLCETTRCCRQRCGLDEQQANNEQKNSAHSVMDPGYKQSDSQVNTICVAPLHDGILPEVVIQDVVSLAETSAFYTRTSLRDPLLPVKPPPYSSATVD